jgi:DNA-binding CsgD family transcriptional regulator
MGQVVRPLPRPEVTSRLRATIRQAKREQPHQRGRRKRDTAEGRERVGLSTLRKRSGSSRQRAAAGCSCRRAWRGVHQPACGAPAGRSAPVASDGELTPREVEVLRLIALGHTGDEIAAKLRISPRTIESHRARIHSKLGLASGGSGDRHLRQPHQHNVEAELTKSFSSVADIAKQSPAHSSQTIAAAQSPRS